MVGWMLSEAIARDFNPSQVKTSLPISEISLRFVNLISLVRVKVNFIKRTGFLSKLCLSRALPFRCSILLIFDSIMGGGEGNGIDRIEEGRIGEGSVLGTDLGFLQTNLGNEVNGN